jgi:hypothetical protein
MRAAGFLEKSYCDVRRAALVEQYACRRRIKQKRCFPAFLAKADIVSSYQLHRLQARMAVLADDEVVVHGDAERARAGSPEGWLCINRLGPLSL